VKAVPLEVRSELVGDLHVFDVAGELDLNTAPALREPLDEAIRNGARAVMVDLSDCEFIDSTGIALLVWAWQELDGRDGAQRRQIALCCPNAQVRRLLELTGVIDAISIHRERDSAIATLS
jgi:anti-sigma B factor antagonist